MKKSFQLNIQSVFLALMVAFFFVILIISMGTIWYTYEATSKAFIQTVDKHMDSITRGSIVATIESLTDITNMVKILAYTLSHSSAVITEDENFIFQAMGILNTEKNIMTVFVGDERGRFVSVGSPSPGQNYVTKYNPIPPDTTFVVQKTDHSGYISKEKRLYLDKNRIVMDTEDSPTDSILYDGRVRPWYGPAKRQQTVHWTNIYLYDNNDLGVTVSAPVVDVRRYTKGVVAIDINMAMMGNIIGKIKAGQKGTPFIITESGELISYPNLDKITNNSTEKHVVRYVHETGNAAFIEAFTIFKTAGKPQFSFKSGGESYMADFVRFPVEYGFNWVAGTVMPESEFLGPLKQALLHIIITSIMVMVVAIFVIAWFSRHISDPLKFLAEDMKRLEKFELNHSLEIKTWFREIGMIIDSFKTMKRNLEDFGRYVPKALICQLMESGLSAKLGGSYKKVTILFSDIYGFTSIAQTMPADKLLNQLSQYFEVLSQVIAKNEGTIDKYMGDAIMAFWGAPLETETNQTERGCLAILQCLWHVNELNHIWAAESLPKLSTRFGLNTADVIVGNIGSSERMSYTVMGGGANVAQRLEVMNKNYGTQALVSEAVFRAMKEKFIFKPVDTVFLEGRSTPSHIYELCAAVSGEFRISDQELEVCNMFFEAFEAYKAREWRQALKLYRAISKFYPHDKIAKMYIDRCTQYVKNPPAPDWNGVYSPPVSTLPQLNSPGSIKKTRGKRSKENNV